MSIQTVQVVINGQTYNLNYNGATGKYEATVTAPTISSFNQPGGFFDVTVKATDIAGNITTKSADTDSNCKLIVKEKVPPVISALSPSNNAKLTSASVTISGSIRDNDSGVNPVSFQLKLDDGTTISQGSTGLTLNKLTGGYDFSYNATGLSNGNHSYTIDVKDNDGNAAPTKTVSFVIDTVAPTLNVINPVDGLVTNQTSLTVNGNTSDAISNPVIVTIKVNGVDQGPITLSNGNFSKTITLNNNSNTVEIKSTDSAGLSTTITRNVTVDTVAPTISQIELIPNPLDAGATFVIKVTATD